MSIVLPALAVAFAAFCVLLTVRIVNRRERWAKRTAVVVAAVFVGYPLSLGPVAWLANAIHAAWADDAYNFIFWPMAQLCDASETIGKILVLYLRLWVDLS